MALSRARDRLVLYSPTEHPTIAADLNHRLSTGSAPASISIAIRPSRRCRYQPTTIRSGSEFAQRHSPDGPQACAVSALSTAVFLYPCSGGRRPQERNRLHADAQCRSIHRRLADRRSGGFAIDHSARLATRGGLGRTEARGTWIFGRLKRLARQLVTSSSRPVTGSNAQCRRSCGCRSPAARFWSARTRCLRAATANARRAVRTGHVS